MARTLQTFERNYLASKSFRCPVHVLSAPGPDIANRRLDLDHVKVLMQSFRTMLKVNEDIVVVVRCDDVPPTGEQLTVEWLKSRGHLEVIAGHHSVEACKNLSAQYPNNKLYQALPVKVYVCPDNALNRQYLRAIGGFDNLIKAIQRKSSKTEITLQIRRHIEAELQDVPEALRTGRIKELKSHWRTIYDLNKATLGTIMVLCNKPVEVWELLEKLLTGTGMEKGYTPPPNPAPFNQIGGLSQEWVCAELRKLIAGKVNFSGFHSSCLREKNHMKVLDWMQDLIVAFGTKKTPVPFDYPEEACGRARRLSA